MACPQGLLSGTRAGPEGWTRMHSLVNLFLKCLWQAGTSQAQNSGQAPPAESEQQARRAGFSVLRHSRNVTLEDFPYFPEVWPGEDQVDPLVDNGYFQRKVREKAESPTRCISLVLELSLAAAGRQLYFRSLLKITKIMWFFFQKWFHFTEVTSLHRTTIREILRAASWLKKSISGPSKEFNYAYLCKSYANHFVNKVCKGQERCSQAVTCQSKAV